MLKQVLSQVRKLFLKQKIKVKIIEKVCDSEENPNVIAPDVDTLSSVRIPKPSCVRWMRKGSSNIVKSDLSSFDHSNLNKNVKRYSRKNLMACNNYDTHSAFDCNNARNALCNARMNASIDVNDLFVFDDYMTGNRALLTNFVEKFLGTVRFGNNDFAVIAGYGDVVIGSMTIKKVYYVEGLGHNLFSLGQFCEKGLEVAFRKSTCFVRSEDGVDLLTSLPKMKFEKDHLCSACEQGKIHRKHHKSKTYFALNKPLYLLHMDLCGPMRIESINGKRFVLVVFDDYSRYTWVFFLHSKDEASEVIISFIKKSQVNLQLQIQRVRTDNGIEFKNKTLAKFFDEVGITQQFSAARMPQQNGVMERRNRTLVEVARTMLTFANLPFFLWAEAITTACFTQNHLIIHKRKEDIGVFIGYSKESTAFRIYNKQTRKIHESVNVNFDEILEMASKQFSLEPGLSNLIEMGKSSNPSVSQVSKTSKKDLEDLFQKFYDEYFDASKIMKSSTMNVETSNIEIPLNEEEVFHESFESIQEGSSSSSLNDDVHQSVEEVAVPSSVFRFHRLQIDLKTTFLNGILKEEVYVGQPSGFVSTQYPDHVYALDKALYGLKQSPRAWYDVLSQFLIDSGFQKVPTLMVEQAKFKLGLVGKPVDHTDYQNRKSTYGSVQFLGDKLVCWSSKKQNYVSISSAESKYVAVSGCCAQVL
nr:hypothetical protein [Tanacetum cinerariifolium]